MEKLFLTELCSSVCPSGHVLISQMETNVLVYVRKAVELSRNTYYFLFTYRSHVTLGNENPSEYAFKLFMGMRRH